MYRYFAIIVTGLFLSFIIYPHAFLSPSNSLPDNNDSRLITYIIGQVQNNIIYHQPLAYGLFFAPNQNTLAYSEPFITSALITLPFRLLLASPIVIFNLAFIINATLTFLASYLLFEFLFKNRFSALFASLLFNLSGYHLAYLPHLQIFSLWPFFLGFYFFLRYQSQNRTVFIWLFFLSLTAQIAESFFPVYLLFFSLFFCYWQRPFPLKRLLLSSLIFFPLWLYLLFPYLSLPHLFPEAVRPIRDAAHFSLGLEEIFTSYHSWVLIAIFILSPPLKLRGGKGALFPWRQILIFSLSMSLGPVLKVFGSNIKIFHLPLPLPYTLFYYFFPGFQGFRTPSRFIILAALAVVISTTAAFSPLFNKLNSKSKFILISLLFISLALEARLPFPAFPIDITPPPVYQQVKFLPENSLILELPIKLWNMEGHEIESIRSLYSLEHRQRRLGGYSGFAPKAWVELVEKINRAGLNPENLARLHSLGVTHVVNNNNLFPLP